MKIIFSKLQQFQIILERIKRKDLNEFQPEFQPQRACNFIKNRPQYFLVKFAKPISKNSCERLILSVNPFVPRHS